MRNHPLFLILVLALTACGGGGSGGPAVTAPQPQPQPPEVPPFGLDSREALAALSLPGETGSGDGGIEVVRAFPNLPFTQPLFLAGVPGDPRLVVLEKTGRMRAFTPAAEVGGSEVILDLSGRVATASEQGLIGLAFDPAFTENRFFYVHYSVDGGMRRSVIARFTWDADTDRADLASERILLEVAQPFGNHNGGMLAFGPDDLLYIALGDGGSGGDPLDHGQNLETLLGSLLRIDVHPLDAAEPYAVPADNPFVDTAGARPEIWAYGLRNPWRFSFDRANGELWLADVGQNAIEEINLIERGGNYGWRVFEGSEPFAGSDNTPAGASFEAPLFEYGHSVGRSVTGGYVYRGSTLPSLVGAYVFGDFGSGNVWALRRNGEAVEVESIGNVASLASFGEDRDGELYLVSLNGTLHRLQAADPGAAEPMATALSETGIFTDVANLTIAPGFIEYDLIVPFWSDGTDKRRWLGVPEDGGIDFDATEPWAFPVGTVLVKHFEIRLDEADPASLRRLETRLLIHRAAGWEGFTYRWNEAGTEASLLADRELEALRVETDEGPITFNYTYPSRSDCLRCHLPQAGSVLGLQTRQMNRDFPFPLATDNQLRTYDHIELFATRIGDVAQFAAFPRLDDSSQPLEERARTYLDVNCAQCHRPDGGTTVALDLRFDAPRWDEHRRRRSAGARSVSMTPASSRWGRAAKACSGNGCGGWTRAACRRWRAIGSMTRAWN